MIPNIYYYIYIYINYIGANLSKDVRKKIKVAQKNEKEKRKKLYGLLFCGPSNPCTAKDGNGAGSDRMKSMCTRTRNPKSKPETKPNTDSGDNSS